ncbi:MAG: hypothetical protein ACFE9L_14390 [Candidatus Hodarchaeota archaeon]
MAKDSFELGNEAETSTHDLRRNNTVLIVEDDEDLLEFYSIILEKINW